MKFHQYLKMIILALFIAVFSVPTATMAREGHEGGRDRGHESRGNNGREFRGEHREFRGGDRFGDSDDYGYYYNPYYAYNYPYDYDDGYGYPYYPYDYDDYDD